MSDKSDKIFLKGLALSGYRSFGPDLQFMGPFSQINVFAGPNNSGKSNILRFIHKHLSQFLNITAGRPGEFESEECHYGIDPLVTVGRGFWPSDEQLHIWFSKSNGLQRETMRWLLNHQANMNGGPIAWWFKRYDAKSGKWLGEIQFQKLPEVRHIFEGMVLDKSPLWRSQPMEWIDDDGRTIRINNVNQIIELFFRDMLRLSPVLPVIRYTPAFRCITRDDSTSSVTANNYGEDGRNLARLYDSIKRASGAAYATSQRKIKRLLEFLKSVTGEPEIDLLVPHDKPEFEILRSREDPEPLSSLGSGIQHLIMIAVAATLREHEIVCLEEPEIFLHPILQRKLIAYLKTTSNQYFISTHSAQFLDVDGVTAFRLEMVNGRTMVFRSDTSSARFSVCRDLGYRASDVVQANCVIWVEGPSEVIYLRKWIAEIDSELREGIEYSIMFYGGALRRWLSGDDPEEAEQLISLVAINRHSVMIADSDKKEESATINENKRRVVAEIESNGGLAWITEGREIENYIPFTQRLRSITALKPSAAEFVDSGKYGCGYPRTTDNKPIIPKVDFAKAICKEPIEWGDLDLKRQVEKLVAYIRYANHQGPNPCVDPKPVSQ